MKPFFTKYFYLQLKGLMRKYPHADNDLLTALDNFKSKNEISIGYSVYKIRIGSSDMKKGKSGSFRAYIYCYIRKELLVPLCMYTKSEHEDISENELKYHFDKVNQELLEKQL